MPKLSELDGRANTNLDALRGVYKLHNLPSVPTGMATHGEFAQGVFVTWADNPRYADCDYVDVTKAGQESVTPVLPVDSTVAEIVKFSIASGSVFFSPSTMQFFKCTVSYDYPPTFDSAGNGYVVCRNINWEGRREWRIAKIEPDGYTSYYKYDETGTGSNVKRVLAEIKA